MHYDHNSAIPGSSTPLVFQSDFPDRVEIVSNSILAGLDYYHVVADSLHETLDGLYAEASIQWEPRFLFNADGSSDFYRLNAMVEAYKPLYISPRKGVKNLFSIYTADYLGLDYAEGNSIPIYLFESYGGRYRLENIALTSGRPGNFSHPATGSSQKEVVDHGV